MDEMNSDKQTRNILAPRRMKLRNPAFTAQVMQAVAEAQFAQQKRRFLRNWLLVILAADCVIGLLIWAFGITLADVGSLPYAIANRSEQALRWMMDYYYLLVPIAVGLIFKKIIESRMRYS